MKVTLHSVIPERQVRNWEGVFEELGAERFPRVLQWSVNRVAADAQDYTAKQNDRIVDRPVEFTRAVRGRRNSSVQTKGRSLNKASDKLRLNDVRATMRRQSAYLKYLLGEEERRPGDVGPSQDHISVPIWSNLAQLQGFLPTAHGNIPKGMTEENLEREYDISAELLRSPRGVDLTTGGEP